MLIFTFVYGEDTGNSRNNKIEIDESLFKRIARDDMTALDELYEITERTMYALFPFPYKGSSKGTGSYAGHLCKDPFCRSSV